MFYNIIFRVQQITDSIRQQIKLFFKFILILQKTFKTNFTLVLLFGRI